MRGTSSIRRKLTTIIMLTAACALLMANVGYVFVDLSEFRSKQASDLTTLASVIGYNASASLLFNERESAKEVLQALRAKPSVVGACIYTRQGKVFAVYGAMQSPAVPSVMGDRVVFAPGKTEVFQSIRFDGETVGTIYIAGDRREFNAQVIRDGKVGVFILLTSLLIAFVVSSRLQRRVSEPIVELARVANIISKDKNFSVRATHPGLDGGDEIGRLMTGFNSMLAEIEQRDDSLQMHRTLLEGTVALRTSELTAANEQLLAAKNAAEISAEINARLARESSLILNSATDGIMGISLDNRLTFLNPAAASMLGVTLGDLKGKSIHDAVHHSYPDGTPWPEADCERTMAMRRGESVATTDDTFWRPDGTSFPVEYSFTSMFDQDENKLGAVVMFRDVTERKAIERMKSEFVSTVSHELRTPLTSIRGALGLLSSGALGVVGEKGRRMLDIAVSNTDRLVRLINDILDLERLGSATVELQRGAVDANAVIVQALESVESMAEQAGVRLAVVPATGTLWGDSDRIIQTLTNLVGNAIKFSPADTTVTVSATERDKDFLFSVSDQGRGIPKEKLATIFERFSQVNGSDSRDKGGSGLGLAICESIVRAHGGRIWAEKNEPTGSRFMFTIPLKASAAIAQRTIEPRSEPICDRDEAKGRSILIVEDDLDLARVMTAALEGRGIRTFHAATGSEAIRMCREYEPSLIVLDLMLPDMDGYEIVRSLRSGAGLERTPLIVYSALDVGTADQPRLRLGPTEFLTKSRCSPAEFEAHVVRMLESVTSRRLAAQKNAA
jgi:PAS domain S-box-containing protein